MNRLVSYSETSSDDEDKSTGFLHPAATAGVAESLSPKCDDHSSERCQSKSSESLNGHNGRPVQSSRLDNGDPITDESDTDQNVDIQTNKHIDHACEDAAVNKSKSDFRCSASETELCPYLGLDLTLPKEAPLTDNNMLSVKRTEPSSLSTVTETVPGTLGHEKSPTDTNSKDTILIDSGKDMNFMEPCVPRSAPKLIQESENLTDSSCLPRKRKLGDDSSDKDKRLCIPDSIQYMYSNVRNRSWVDDPAQHDNRVRSFPHVEGNWATHVYVQVKQDERFVRFVANLLKFLQPPSFQALPEFHVSISRTVTVRHHWIEPLVDSLRENLRHLKSCMSDLTAVKLFTNDEKTRTFVCLELSEEDTEFLNYVKAVDKSFAEFKLPPYYENPSFHISIGWCLGDTTGIISDEKLIRAREMLGDFVAANPDLSVVYVQQICCQSGNKSFVMTLEES